MLLFFLVTLFVGLTVGEERGKREEWMPIEDPTEAEHTSVPICEALIEKMYADDNVFASDTLTQEALEQAQEVLEEGSCAAAHSDACKFIPKKRKNALVRGCRTFLNEMSTPEETSGGQPSLMQIGCGYVARDGVGGAVVCVTKGQTLVLSMTVSKQCDDYIQDLYDSTSNNVERNEDLVQQAVVKTKELLDIRKCAEVDDVSRCKFINNLTSYTKATEFCRTFIEGIDPSKPKIAGCSFQQDNSNGATTCIIRNKYD